MTEFEKMLLAASKEAATLNIHEAIENGVKHNNNGGNSPIEFNNPEPCPDFKTLLPEYFTNRDGSKLLDPKSEKGLDIFRISQSFTGGFRQTLIDGTCLKRFYYKSVERKGDKKAEETEAMRLGTLFEYYLTGAYDYYGNKPVAKRKYIGSEKEAYYAADKRVIDNAKVARESLKHFGIDLDAKVTYSVDTKFFFKCFDGSADLRYFNHRLLDCKYTGILKKPDKYSKESWNEENVGKSFSKKIQSALYSFLYFLKEGVYPSFDYIVFSNKADEKAEFQIFGMDISKECFNSLQWLMVETANLFQSMINENKFIEKPSFDNCKGCPVLDCKVKQVYRKKIVVSI